MKAKSIIHVAAAFLIFKLTDGFSNVAFRLSVSDIAAEIVYVFLAVFSIYVFVRLYAAYIMKRPAGELGLAGPWPDKVWCIVAAALPAAVIFFYLLFMDGVFAVRGAVFRGEGGNYFPWNDPGSAAKSLGN